MITSHVTVMYIINKLHATIWIYHMYSATCLNGHLRFTEKVSHIIHFVHQRCNSLFQRSEISTQSMVNKVVHKWHRICCCYISWYSDIYIYDELRYCVFIPLLTNVQAAYAWGLGLIYLGMEGSIFSLDSFHYWVITLHSFRQLIYDPSSSPCSLW